MSGRNLWRGPAGKMSQHFSVCTSAILHLVWKGRDSHNKATLLRGSFLIPRSYSINMCTERQGLKRGCRRSRVWGCRGRFVTDLSLQSRYWPATAWTEKFPAVLFPLHRLAHSLIYWWHGQYLDVSPSTLSMRTGRKGIAVMSNVNLLCPHSSPAAENDCLATKHGAQFSSTKEGTRRCDNEVLDFVWHTAKKGFTSELCSEAVDNSTHCNALKLLKIFANNHWCRFLTGLCDVKVLCFFFLIYFVLFFILKIPFKFVKYHML